MTTYLPNLITGFWTVTALVDSLERELANDKQGETVNLFFYAVTESGWDEVRHHLLNWRKRKTGRNIFAYIGTDHAITDPKALRNMARDKVNVRIMQDYTGVFHPKVIWLNARRANAVWIGSNNLTRDGLLRNIEFAAMLKSKTVPASLQKWATEINSSSIPYSRELIDNYEAERRKYRRKQEEHGNFVWSRREKAQKQRSRRAKKPRIGVPQTWAPSLGDLVVEVMPKETGQDGKQIQLPITATKIFFGLTPRAGASRSITLKPTWAKTGRTLTMTFFSNHTVRLVINELEYDDRPCLLVFRRQGEGQFNFDIVSRSVFPKTYRQLLAHCINQTGKGSRRWGIVGAEKI